MDDFSGAGDRPRKIEGAPPEGLYDEPSPSKENPDAPGVKKWLPSNADPDAKLEKVEALGGRDSPPQYPDPVACVILFCAKP